MGERVSLRGVNVMYVMGPWEAFLCDESKCLKYLPLFSVYDVIRCKRAIIKGVFAIEVFCCRLTPQSLRTSGRLGSNYDEILPPHTSTNKIKSNFLLIIARTINFRGIH